MSTERDERENVKQKQSRHQSTKKGLTEKKQQQQKRERENAAENTLQPSRSSGTHLERASLFIPLPDALTWNTSSDQHPSDFHNTRKYKRPVNRHHELRGKHRQNYRTDHDRANGDRGATAIGQRARAAGGGQNEGQVRWQHRARRRPARPRWPLGLPAEAPPKGSEVLRLGRLPDGEAEGRWRETGVCQQGADRRGHPDAGIRASEENLHHPAVQQVSKLSKLQAELSFFLIRCCEICRA